jgi:hypothetical protein
MSTEELVDAVVAEAIPRRRGRPPIDRSKQVDETDLIDAPRAEDPRVRAAKRALELREHMGTVDDGGNQFYVDPRIIPDGWSYEWKTRTVLNQENPGYQVKCASTGWEDVPAHRHPQMMPVEYKGMTIDRMGMRLMERPLEITEEVKARDLKNARDQVRQKEAQLTGAPAGTFERDNKGNTLVNVKKSYAQIPIPRE